PLVWLHFCVNSTPAPDVFPLSLHDALPIYGLSPLAARADPTDAGLAAACHRPARGRAGTRLAASAPGHPGSQRSCQALGSTCPRDRKSTRLNSSHVKISYAVFCLKKKKKET